MQRICSPQWSMIIQTLGDNESTRRPASSTVAMQSSEDQSANNLLV